MKKLRFSRPSIREQCTGAAFDGQYSNLNCLEVLAKRIVEEAKGAPAKRSEIQSLVKWLLCTWDPAQRLELIVANDIQIGRLGVDVELMQGPWYA